MRYVVRRPRPQTLLSLATVAVIALVFLKELGFSPYILAAVVAVALVQAYNQALALRVDESGVRLPPAFVPWSSIDAVVADGDELGVRLRREAPLPDGVPGVIHDPRGAPPVPPALRRRIRGLDRAALESAVAAFGGGVRLDYDFGRR
jgi:hypothetical protein